MNRYTVELVLVTDSDPTEWIVDAMTYQLARDGEDILSATLTNIEPLELDGE